MSAKSRFTMGFLSVIAVAGLFAASIGFAADAPDASKTTAATSARSEARSDDFKIIKVVQDGRWQVVDSKGNVYLLTEVKNNQACEERPHAYTQPMSH
ncbi:MAG: hypothetical protein EWM72_00540 [Nitrospira sp.]|nr:MAG: hypothetical protein EWM72_00540 [Nitrospira sp.]